MPPVYYQPGRFPPEGQLDWRQLIPHIGPATFALARYDGTLATIPNPSVLLAPLTTQEAVLSSRIEGTQATMAEVLQFEAGWKPDSSQRRHDIDEVRNYCAALRQAIQLLKNLPLSQRVLLQAHQVLLRGAQGKGKSPGDYRRVPNWIGPPGCTQEEARFVPIEAGKIPDAMSAWERYIHAEAPDKLVQLAILHAEFEAIHPFLDGNGRLGRMFVPLFLWQVELIHAPMFYISAYLETHPEAYYDGLLAVSRDNDWTGWCQFFLKAIRHQAEDNLTKCRNIINFYNTMKTDIVELTRSQYAIFALDWIFERPIFRSTDFLHQAKVPSTTARRILNSLRENETLKIIHEGRGSRAAVMAFSELLNIIKGTSV